jgi:L-threonine kinase
MRMSPGNADLPAAGQTNRLIFQQFPQPIRQLYATAVTERSPAARHGKLCKLGEGALAYMASMALSDYRNRRHTDPDPKTESVLAGMKRISMGQYLQIFRAATEAIQPALFDYKLTRPESCVAAGRFSTAYAAIEDAIELEARNLRKIVAQRLESPRQCSWLAFWERLIEYRNRAEAHPATYNWPVGHADYYAIMTPTLEHALVEALTAPHVERVFRDHPLATLVNISYGPGGYIHEVAGEDLGLPFESHISLDRSVTDIWSQESWKARPGCTLMLGKMPSGAYEIDGLMHDLVADGPPVSLAAGVPHGPRVVAAGARSTSPWRTATQTAVGTCGELVQGFTSHGVPFHVTCPISKSATVTVTARPAPEFMITQIDGGLGKTARALRQAAALLGLEPLEIRVEHWSDLDIGKGMGSSTADIVAASRALAEVAGRSLSPGQLAKIATSIESSDGSMHPGLVAFNQKTGQVIEAFSWWPQLAIVMIIPPQVFNTESADFSGKEKYGTQFDELLASLRAAASQHDTAAFAQAATQSAALNQRFVPNPYYSMLEDRIGGFGALGINIAHTGTVAGLLFDAADGTAAKAAAAAAMELHHLLPASTKVDITLTPKSPE